MLKHLALLPSAVNTALTLFTPEVLPSALEHIGLAHKRDPGLHGKSTAEHKRHYQMSIIWKMTQSRMPKTHHINTSRSSSSPGPPTQGYLINKHHSQPCSLGAARSSCPQTLPPTSAFLPRLAPTPKGHPRCTSLLSTNCVWPPRPLRPTTRTGRPLTEEGHFLTQVLKITPKVPQNPQWAQAEPVPSSSNTARAFLALEHIAACSPEPQTKDGACLWGAWCTKNAF